MPKIHKNKTPVPGRILVQGFSWMEASAKFVSFFGYAIFKELKAFLPFHKVRAEYEFKGLDNAMDYLYEYNTQQNWDSTRECTLIELDVEGCYPSINIPAVNLAFEFFLNYVPQQFLPLYINVWARALYLLDHAYIQVDGILYKQTQGLAQGSAAAPFLADFTLFRFDLEFRAFNPRVWHGRYLDDILLAIPCYVSVGDTIRSIKQIFAKGNQLLTVQTAGRDGYSAWLGFEIKPNCQYRVHIKPTWVNLFSPLYDSISPRLHFGYLIIMAIRFTTFSSSNVNFQYIWNIFTSSLPARGYPLFVSQMILDKIKWASGFDLTDPAGHLYMKQRFSFWMRQTKSWRKENAHRSPYRELWEGTLNSTELLHINQVLAADLIGGRPTIRPSPTWTITHIPCVRPIPRGDTTIVPHSPDPPSDHVDYNQSINSEIASSIDSYDSFVNGPDWFKHGDLPGIAINMSWHDAITTQFRGEMRGGAGSDTEHPLRVGAPIPGTSTTRLLCSPLSKILGEPVCYQPRLLEEPSTEALEALRPLFFGNILSIAEFLWDFQILPSYRKSWLPPGPPEYFMGLPDSLARTFEEIALLQDTFETPARTEIALLHEEITQLHLAVTHHDDDSSTMDQALVTPGGISMVLTTSHT